MKLLGLAPDIQEEIFLLPPVIEGRPAITERHLRQVLKTVVWSEQQNLLGLARTSKRRSSSCRL